MVPYGFQFRQEQTNWDVPDMVARQSFGAAVEAISAMRRQNPRQNLSTNPDDIANELDAYTCKRLTALYGDQASQWVASQQEYSPPTRNFLRRSPAAPRAAAAIKRLGAGIGLVRDWLGDGLNPVDQATAEARAAICATCPLNQPSDTLQWAYSQVADGLKLLMEVRQDMDLHTSHDNYLKTCHGCDCDLKLKCFCPAEYIKKRTSPETMARLDDRCWIKKL